MVIHYSTHQVSETCLCRAKMLLFEFSAVEHKGQQEAAGTLMFVLWCLLSDGEIATGSHFKKVPSHPLTFDLFLCVCVCVYVCVPRPEDRKALRRFLIF